MPLSPSPVSGHDGDAGVVVRWRRAQAPGAFPWAVFTEHTTLSVPWPDSSSEEDLPEQPCLPAPSLQYTLITHCPPYTRSD